MAENPMTDEEYQRTKKGAKLFGKVNTFVYRLTGGRLMTQYQDWDICVVKTTGAKTGKTRWVPVMYVPHQGGIIMVGSLAGSPKSPVWVNNLRAHPQVEVLHRGSKKQLLAREVFDQDRAAVWPECVKHYPPYADYQARTDRVIPVFICEPGQD